MKVMLVTQKSKETIEKWMPIGLCYIAASLREKGHEVRIFDRYALGCVHTLEVLNKKMQEEIIDFNPDYIGLSAVSPLIYDAIEIIKIIKEVFDKKIFMGGHHVTAFPELTLKRLPELDVVIIGEGERSVVKYVEGKKYEDIQGLYWRKNNDIAGNKRDLIDNLDELPLPAYDLLDMSFYLKPTIGSIRGFYQSVISILAARGCPNQCSYCTESLTFSKGIRFHSVEYVIKNIEYLLKHYQFDSLTFFDNDFLANKKHAINMLNKFIVTGIHKKIKFCIQTRASHIDENIARLLKDAGCIKIEFGLESNKQETLDQVGKNMNINTYEKAINICNQVGISVQGNMIHGMENETIKDLKDAFKWLKSLRLDDWKWFLLSIHPGSLLYREKGNQFFEMNHWDKDTIESYYQRDHLTEINTIIKNRFIKKVKLYARFRHYIIIWKNNSFLKSIQYFISRINRRLQSNVK